MYSTGIAYLLWFISGFGALGFHRFYMGKFGTGLLYLFTGGLFGVGCVYDLLTIPIQVREANLRIGWRNALLDRPIREVGGYSARNRESERRETLERVILRTAKKNSGVTTPTEVALEGDCTLDAAKTALDKLVEKGYAELRVNKNGGLVYFFADFSANGTHPDLEDF